MPSKFQQVHNKNHGGMKRLSGVGRKGRASLRSRNRNLKSIGKIYDVNQEDKNPASVIQKVHLFEKQRDFLTAQADVFDRRTATLREEIQNLTDRIAMQYKHAQTVFNRGASESDDIDLDANVDTVVTKSKKKNKKADSNLRAVGKNKVFSIKY